MKIRHIAGFIGTIMLTSACHTNKPKPVINYVNRAYEHAIQHMTPEEVSKMRNNVTKQMADFSEDVSYKIFYWDSVLASKKAEEAYIQGQQFVRDSLAGINYPKREFKLPLDTIFRVPRKGKDIADSSHIELVEYIGGEEMYELVQKEPKLINPNSLSKQPKRSRNNHITHYYGVVGSAAQERAAYNAGIASMRNK